MRLQTRSLTSLAYSKGVRENAREFESTLHRTITARLFEEESSHIRYRRSRAIHASGLPCYSNVNVTRNDTESLAGPVLGPVAMSAIAQSPFHLKVSLRSPIAPVSTLGNLQFLK